LVRRPRCDISCVHACLCAVRCCSSYHIVFFFSDTAPTEIYTLSLHDALPISLLRERAAQDGAPGALAPGALVPVRRVPEELAPADRKSTRLNSSHGSISYAVFCLKKKKKQKQQSTHNDADQEARRQHTTY